MSSVAANRVFRRLFGTLISYPLDVPPTVRLLGYLRVVLYTFLRHFLALFYNGRDQDSNWWQLTEENDALSPEITRVGIQDTPKSFCSTAVPPEYATYCSREAIGCFLFGSGKPPLDLGRILSKRGDEPQTRASALGGNVL